MYEFLIGFILFYIYCYYIWSEREIGRCENKGDASTGNENIDGQVVSNIHINWSNSWY